MSFDFKLTDNTDEYKRALKSQLEQGMKAIAMKAETNAKRYCPVDTGNLKNSITHESNENEAIIGTNVEYGKFVELGTEKMKAQPYLRPAFSEHLDEYKRLLEEALK